MPPPTLAQDRLARAQHPIQQSSRATSGPSRGLSGTNSTRHTGPVASNSASSIFTNRGGPAVSGVRGGRAAPGSTQARSSRAEASLTGEEARCARDNESWEDRQRRHKAATVLASCELLAWYAVAGNEVRLRTFLVFLRCPFAILASVLMQASTIPNSPYASTGRLKSKPKSHSSALLPWPARICGTYLARGY